MNNRFAIATLLVASARAESLRSQDEFYCPGDRCVQAKEIEPYTAGNLAYECIQNGTAPIAAEPWGELMDNADQVKADLLARGFHTKECWETVLPPGREDKFYCPKDRCVVGAKDIDPDFAGPASAYFRCFGAGVASIPVEPWGYSMDNADQVKADLLARGFHTRMCGLYCPEDRCVQTKESNPDRMEPDDYECAKAGENPVPVEVWGMMNNNAEEVNGDLLERGFHNRTCEDDSSLTESDNSLSKGDEATSSASGPYYFHHLFASLAVASVIGLSP